MTSVCDSRVTPARVVLALLAGMGMGEPGEVRAEDRSTSEAFWSVDSEHMFGFTVGSDIGSAGEIEIEGEQDSGFGKRAGRYYAAMNSLQLKYTATDSFRIAPHVEFGHHAISSVPGMVDLNNLGIASGGVEFKYRFLNRVDAPFGLTLGVDTSMGRIDSGTGQRTRDYALDVSLALDRELIKNRLFGAINVVYAPSWARDHATGIWERAAATEISAALTNRIANGVFLGGEVRYLRAYETAGLSGFAGDAVFAGPTLYVMFSPRANMTLAWNVQVAGRSRDERDRLDLINFERHQVRLRFGFGF
ncbi:hypothetical protein [Bradyrhizobium sp. SYSU BS000235]|uniref:hypothetical protein n=1 Tax=Bradyrhizobium sp. SYSU BS000235 TaxID=3411332 RepID=UPI003C761C74